MGWEGDGHGRGFWLGGEACGIRGRGYRQDGESERGKIAAELGDGGHLNGDDAGGARGLHVGGAIVDEEDFAGRDGQASEKVREDGRFGFGETHFAGKHLNVKITKPIEILPDVLDHAGLHIRENRSTVAGVVQTRKPVGHREADAAPHFLVALLQACDLAGVERDAMGFGESAPVDFGRDVAAIVRNSRWMVGLDKRSRRQAESGGQARENRGVRTERENFAEVAHDRSDGRARGCAGRVRGRRWSGIGGHYRDEFSSNIVRGEGRGVNENVGKRCGASRRVSGRNTRIEMKSYAADSEFGFDRGRGTS